MNYLLVIMQSPSQCPRFCIMGPIQNVKYVSNRHEDVQGCHDLEGCSYISQFDRNLFFYLEHCKLGFLSVFWDNFNIQILYRLNGL